MKQISTFLLMSLMAVIIASCSQNTVGGGGIQKRKYTRGFYLNRNHSFKGADNNKVSETEAPAKEEIRSEAAEETARNEQPVVRPNVVVRQEVSVQQDQTEKNQKPVENQKAPVKKKTVETKTQKPSAPTRPKRDRENEYFIPAKQQSVVHQQSNSAGGHDDMFILAVIFAILIPPIGVLIYTNIDWMKVLICLLLTILFFLPGMIYALLVVFDVF